MMLVYVGVPVLIISLMIRLAKYLKAAGNERKLLRLELSKLADEVQQIRQELKAKSTNEVSSDK
jgi:predicted RNase H-like nuclease